MPATHNKHGLGRNIPEDVKRTVRQRCGFGCAICGTTITEYEHFLPSFSDAVAHDPDSIVLLCPSHHTEVTKGVVPKSAVAEAARAPAAAQAGFSYRSLPWFEGIPTFKVGGVTTCGTKIPFWIKGAAPISFDEPEEGSKVARISAKIDGPDGKQLLKVDQNEWRVSGDAADFKWIGKRYRFYDHRKTLILSFRFDPPDLLTIETLRTVVGGLRIEATDEYLEINGQRVPVIISNHCPIGMMIN